MRLIDRTLTSTWIDRVLGVLDPGIDLVLGGCDPRVELDLGGHDMDIVVVFIDNCDQWIHMAKVDFELKIFSSLVVIWEYLIFRL